MKVDLTLAAQDDARQTFLWYRRESSQIAASFKSDLDDPFADSDAVPSPMLVCMAMCAG